MHDSSPPPRRSQRDRKSVKPFNSSTKASARKRKRRDTDHEDDIHPLSDDARDARVEGDEGRGEDEEEEEEEYRIGPGRKGKGKATPKPKPGAAVKKPRKTRTSKKARDGPEPDQLAKDTNIANDNALFSESFPPPFLAHIGLTPFADALVNPAVPLQSTAEDFIDSLRQSPAAAQAELVNLILRCCGCNDSVDADAAVDYDGVVDTLDNFTESLKQVSTSFFFHQITPLI